MGRMNKVIGVRDTPGSAEDAVNTLLFHFGFKSTGKKGRKGPEFPLKKSGRTCKAVHPGRQEIWLTMGQSVRRWWCCHTKMMEIRGAPRSWKQFHVKMMRAPRSQ